MKILFVGTLISKEEMEHLNSIGNRKASVAPNNYETMLVKGFSENGAQVDVMSVPAVAAYPGNPTVLFHKRSERLPFGVLVQWIPFVNIQAAKQASIQICTYRMVKQWLIENKDVEEKCVVTYSIYPPYTKPLVHLCKKYHCHLSTVITDLPEYMYTWGNDNPIAAYLGNVMKKKMLMLQGQCDSYVLFTKKMAARMRIEGKPYIVSEGFSDAGIFDGIIVQEKNQKKTLLYAGNLSRLYGIRSLVDGFMRTEGKQELHFYGSGEDVAYIQQCAERDRRIHYFGRVSREEVLCALERAHLIVINKPTADDYSNYSFSSKILECMVSGTPVLTTRVGGMPEEYYPYLYFIDDETPQGIAKAIEAVLALSENALAEKGQAAKQFAITAKNYLSQTNDILDFLSLELNRKAN
jgi:glycosyltransferase involved in cell wall biosynthesis